MTVATRATIHDLMNVKSKAELIEGEIVFMAPTGDFPSSAGGAVYSSLREYARKTSLGRAYTDNVGYVVRLPHRESFSPDSSFHVGARSGMRFLEGAPIFAVEVRSENDYGDASERNMAQKRADYFACGTLVVWDVDLLGTDVIRSYRADAPYSPRVFQKDDLANAEPALPDWVFAVKELFE
jgi:Uma2 family endonuclease